MKVDKKVQFVCFETMLDKEPFIKRWEQYTHSLNSNEDVTMQQSEKNGIFRYIAQHRFVPGELQFVFSKESGRSRVVQVQIKTTQVGGYSILQMERSHGTTGNENKFFVFLTDPTVDLTVYKKLSVPCELNIYEEYYENCKYAFILEYFVKAKNAAALLEQLNLDDIAEIGLYKECTLDKSSKNDREKDLHVWP
ncbi:MAG: hypothetical protein ABIO76_07855 [Ginsengibacter sp.]